MHVTISGRSSHSNPRKNLLKVPEEYWTTNPVMTGETFQPLSYRESDSGLRCSSPHMLPVRKPRYTTYDNVSWDEWLRVWFPPALQKSFFWGYEGDNVHPQEHPGESIRVGRLCFSYRSRRLCSVLAIVTARLKLPSYRNGMVCSHRSHPGWSVLNLFRCLITYASEVNHRIYSQQKVQSVISKPTAIPSL